jgi:predicted metallopeptidase
MGIRYELAPDMQKVMIEISNLLFPHVRLDSVVCIRSYGSKSRGTIARCHALGKAMMIAMGRKKSYYVIEFIHERFDKMPEIEKIKTVIHELMHIPKTFGGGFRHHDYVCDENIEVFYEKYVNLKKKVDNDENENISNKKKVLFGKDFEESSDVGVNQNDRYWW